jgi:transcriptional regulator with XRE-family HTH domain
MTVDPEELLEPRVPSPAELANFIKLMREVNKWIQATLAEIARVTERTIQRVENGEPSSLDTRRALATAFGYEDLDVFDKPWPFPNIEKLKAYTAELNKTTVVVPLNPRRFLPARRPSADGVLPLRSGLGAAVMQQRDGHRLISCVQSDPQSPRPSRFRPTELTKDLAPPPRFERPTPKFSAAVGVGDPLAIDRA